MNYYCFVAGSKDLSLEVTKGTPMMLDLLEEYKSMLSGVDMKLIDLLRLSYDNANLLALMKDKEAKISPLGTIGYDTWMEALPLMLDSESKDIQKEFGIPEYFTEYYQVMNDDTLSTKVDFPENYIYSIYYDYAKKRSNNFLRSWFEYNLSINNVVSAIVCKKYYWDIAKNMVGGGEIVETIRSNQGSKDFGLSGVYDDIDVLISISDQKELVDQERRYDALRWAWLEENTFFANFSVEQIISYWLRCEMIHRWDYLTEEEGRRVFNDILSEMNKNIKF